MKFILSILLLHISACVKNERIALPPFDDVTEIRWERQTRITSVIFIDDAWYLSGMEKLNEKDVRAWYASLDEEATPVIVDELIDSILQGELSLSFKGIGNQCIISFYLKGDNWYIHNTFSGRVYKTSGKIFELYNDIENVMGNE